MADAMIKGPVRGELWSLSGSDVVGLVWRLSGSRVEVLAVLERSVADEWSVLLGPSASSEGALAVHVALAVCVPVEVLDARVGVVFDVDPVAALSAAYRSGVPHDVVTGVPVRSSADPRVGVLDELGERFAVLAGAGVVVRGAGVGLT